jgi:hypothetical protein
MRISSVGRNHILPFFDDRQLQAIDGTVIETWMDQFGDDVEAGRRRHRASRATR